jgi:ribosomal subunit interface protein
MSDPTLVISFKDLPTDEPLREAVERRCLHIAGEFPEITRIEVTLAEDGSGFSAHGHVHVAGKNAAVNTQAEASEMGHAADRLLDRVEKQLRRFHDKRIFTLRREAQKHPPKKG